MLNSKDSNFGLTEATFAVVRRFNEAGLSSVDQSLIAQLNAMIRRYVNQLEQYNPYNKGATTDVVEDVIIVFWEKVANNKVTLKSLKSLLNKIHFKKGVDIYRKATNPAKLLPISDEFGEQAQAKRIYKTTSLDLLEGIQCEDDELCSFEAADNSRFKKQFALDLLKTRNPKVRATMIHHYLEDEPLTTLAAQQGIDENCVAKRHSDARKSMFKKYKNIYYQNCCD